MYTRSVDEAQKRLHELRQVEWQDLGLGGLALGFAVAATQVRESLALPLFVGGVTLLVLGLRALWQRWDLVDRLAGERDAYGISEVLEYASRETSMDRRRTFAAMIRNRLDEQAADSEDRSAKRQKNSRRWCASLKTQTSSSTRRVQSRALECSATWPRARSSIQGSDRMTFARVYVRSAPVSVLGRGMTALLEFARRVDFDVLPA
jgi:hypothetical protein